MTEKKKRKRREHPLFDYEYETEVTYQCPVRGEVTEKVKIKRYKSKMSQHKHVVGNEDELDAMLEEVGVTVKEDE